MKKFRFISALMLFPIYLLNASPTFSPGNGPVQIVPPKQPKIQAAILLDVSNSMDGLIEQAKAQLWKMMNILGKTSCDGIPPKIEIALYEYGRPSNGEKNGFVRQISPFGSDLDILSKKLFELQTDGGVEYCGRVIFKSLEELSWDNNPGSYKVIFIAGNEDFRQGDLVYTKACALAKDKGVIVNTIFCGDRLQGISEHWNLGAECGNGSYTNINADVDIREIPTPYDDQILALNQKLNGTYIAYGGNGKMAYERQVQVDGMNRSMSPGVAVDRAVVKGNKELYNNATWDIVDATESSDEFLKQLDKKSLPDSLQQKTANELRAFVNTKSSEREAVRSEIQKLAQKREQYIRTNKKQVETSQTLQSGIEKIIRQQAGKFKMIIR